MPKIFCINYCDDRILSFKQRIFVNGLSSQCTEWMWHACKSDAMDKVSEPMDKVSEQLQSISKTLASRMSDWNMDKKIEKSMKVMMGASVFLEAAAAVTMPAAILTNPALVASFESIADMTNQEFLVMMQHTYEMANVAPWPLVKQPS